MNNQIGADTHNDTHSNHVYRLNINDIVTECDFVWNVQMKSLIFHRTAAAISTLQLVV